nr:hypothetical protein [Bacillus thuringiensis]
MFEVWVWNLGLEKGAENLRFFGGVFRPVFGRFLRAKFSRFFGLNFLS